MVTLDSPVQRLFWTPLKRMMELLWSARSRLPYLDFPIPWRLPYGGWFLAYGDAMGARVCGYKLARRPYEENEWKFVSRFLKPGMTFVDIGANQGFYTILASKRVGSEGKVVAFEPASSELRKLRRNVFLNRCRNVIVEPQAVGKADGFTEFHVGLFSRGSFSSITRPAADVTSYERVTVPITSLNNYVATNKVASLDFIKIDVEGGELDVLRGGATVLERFRPVIMCEIEDRRTLQWGYPARMILEYLSAHRYAWFAVTRDGRLEPSPEKTSYAWANLVAVPEERLLATGTLTE